MTEQKEVYRFMKIPKLVIWMFLLEMVSSAFSDEKKLSFNRHIRPNLSDGCFHCHGLNEAGRLEDLCLNLEKFALRLGRSGFRLQ